jgi:DNA-binding NtrC family response regulator
MKLMHSSTIFIVDQDSISSMIVKRKLVEDPFLKVSAFRNGAECVADLEAKPGVVILDFATPGPSSTDGASTLHAMLQRCPDTQVILLASKSNIDTVRGLVSDRVLYVFKRPNCSAQLKRMVGQLLIADHVVTQQVA